MMIGGCTAVLVVLGAGAPFAERLTGSVSSERA